MALAAQGCAEADMACVHPLSTVCDCSGGILLPAHIVTVSR